MGLSHLTVVAAISLSGLIPWSCSKTPATPQTALVTKTNATTASVSKIKDLGVIQLTNRYETEINLGQGKSCTIKPQLLDRHNLQLTLSFGSRSPDGRPTGLCVARVIAQPNQPFDITVNDEDLTFTPKLAE